MPENVNEPIPLRPGRLLKKLNQWVVWALQEDSPHWHFLVNASPFEGVDERPICRARPFTSVPGGSNDQLPLLELRHIVPLTQSDGNASSVESLQHLRLDDVFTS